MIPATLRPDIQKEYKEWVSGWHYRYPTETNDRFTLCGDEYISGLCVCHDPELWVIRTRHPASFIGQFMSMIRPDREICEVYAELGVRVMRIGVKV